MKNINFQYILGKFIGFVFISLSFVLLKEVTNQDFKLLAFLLLLFCYFLLITGFIMLAPSFIKNHKITKYIFSNIAYVPIRILFFIISYMSPVITIIGFVGFYFAPIILTRSVFKSFNVTQPYMEGTVYLVASISVVVFAYCGSKIMTIILSTIYIKRFEKVFIKITSRNYTRQFTYILMILMYMIYNFIDFSSSSFNVDILYITKEVLVTFVALDSLIQLYLKEKTYPVDSNKIIP